MNVYRVLQRLEGTFEMTVTNDDHTSPVGYCRAWREWDETLQQMSPTAYDQYLRDKAKYHGEGHATPEEAAACYKQYLLDTRLTLKRKHDHEECCLVCGAISPLYASLDHHRYALCEAHNTREQVEARFVMTADIQIISSY